MKVDKPHTLSKDEARERIQALTEYWDTRYGTATRWAGDNAHIKGKVKGISFDGTFRLDDRRLTGEVKVGWLAEKAGGRAYVEKKLDEYLSPQTTLEELRARISG